MAQVTKASQRPHSATAPAVRKGAKISKMHLYVMQNEHGLIKIGRGASPERRRRTIERELGCKIALVISMPNRGHHEESVHIRLAQFRVGPERRSEWFDGTDLCRSAVSMAIEFEDALNWPYPFNKRKAANWLSKFEDHQADRYLRALDLRTLGVLKAAMLGLPPFEDCLNGDAMLDADIADVGFGEMVTIGSHDDGRTRAYCVEKIGKKYIKTDVPPYTTHLETALTLWRSKKLANAWLRGAGTSPRAIECCVVALGDAWGIDVEKLKPRRGR